MSEETTVILKPPGYALKHSQAVHLPPLRVPKPRCQASLVSLSRRHRGLQISLHRDRLPLSGNATKPCDPAGYLQATVGFRSKRLLPSSFRWQCSTLGCGCLLDPRQHLWVLKRNPSHWKVSSSLQRAAKPGSPSAKPNWQCQHLACPGERCWTSIHCTDSPQLEWTVLW